MFDIIILFSSARIVKPNTKKRVLLLWKHRRVLESGFHLIIPFLETTTELPVVVAKNSTKEAKETSLKKGEVQKWKKVTNDSYESFRDSFFSRDKK
jgi:regulator of protease activity HflC (stomatin/prohibitin superfamily)